MAEQRVPLTRAIPERQLKGVEIDGDLAARFKSVAPAASDKFSELSREFYETFLKEVGFEEQGELLTRVARSLSELPDDQLDNPIMHPVIGEAEFLVPPVGNPLAYPYGEALAWLVGVMGGPWRFDASTRRPVDPRAIVPEWFVYCLLELVRGYIAEIEPELRDRTDKRPRALAFLRLDHEMNAEWFLGRSAYMPEIVFIKAAWIRTSSESREDFLLRIVGDVVDSALGQIVPEAESMDRYVHEIGMPYPDQDPKADLERARECARMILGHPMPDAGGSATKVRERLLEQLGFFEPTKA